jgi:hypothetical protein
MSLRAAAQQALEAMEYTGMDVGKFNRINAACAALRTALSEPEQEPLTDEEISDLWCEVSNTDFVTADTHVFARAIERAHGIGGEE